MHLQDGTANWPDAVPLLPPHAIVKAVNGFGRLKEAVDKWTGAGGPRGQLYTCYRFHDLFMTVGDWESCKAQWRVQFAKFLDRSNLPYFEQGYVNLVEDVNEYTATSTWTSPVEKAKVLQSMRAAVAVWNGEIRGKRITTHDGAVGTIPDDCKLVLCNGPVGNDIAPEVLQLGVSTDSPIGYHPYTRYSFGVRFANDWRDDSGRWHFMEQAAGVKPEWVFTENTPYAGVNEGWRHPTVLDAKPLELVAAMRRWARDVVGTPAYNEGRLLGWTGAWFTVGGGGRWPFYELQADQLKALAVMFAEEWKPIDPGEPMTNVPVAVLQKLDALAAEQRALLAPFLPPPAPVPLYRVRVVRGVLVRDANGVPVTSSSSDPLTGVIPPPTELNVYAEFPLSPHGNRVAIHPDQRNVWADNVVRLP